MTRNASMIVAVTSATLLATVFGLALGDGLELGVPFNGEIPAKSKRSEVIFKKTPQAKGKAVEVVSTELPVNLTAGQKVSIQVKVSGPETRKAALALKDTAGKQVALTQQLLPRSNELAFEASATGLSHIVVISDQVGAFKLRVDPEGGDDAVEPDAEALKAKIRRLKQELSEAEAKLEALAKPAAKTPATKKRP
jgi:hypothetical protein